MTPPSTVGASGGDGDRIQLRGLRVVGTHGVLPQEKDRAQPFEIDLDLVVDLGPAAASDALTDTVDYGRIADVVAGVVSDGPSFDLLEAMAGAMASSVLEADRRVDEVTVALRKLEPPLSVDIATVGVLITRRR